jgi:2,3-bisphosphoglycerate-independent phosphoglycerate mutase
MDIEKITSELSVKTPTKIILFVMDGLGGLPYQGLTALEAAPTPHLDDLAKKSVCGLTDPVFRGIIPGSGPAHLALFGYPPTKYLLGRGILEALGVGVEVGKNDLVARGNFATLKENVIVDRRAGRIPTSENERLCQKLNTDLKTVMGTEVELYPGKEHRFVVKFHGEELSDKLSDADPQKENKPVTYTQPLADEAERTSKIVNSFIDETTLLLKNSSKANTVLLRGFSKFPAIPTLSELFKLKPLALAHYPMYQGLARLVGMDVFEVGPELEELISALESHFQDYDFFYVHMKKTDAAGEDGDFDSKRTAIEEADKYIPRLAALQPDVLVVTSDHSTPCLLKSHSWHPNPFLLHAQSALTDDVERFSERACAQGFLGRFQAVYAMTLMLAHAGKLKKFGA